MKNLLLAASAVLLFGLSSCSNNSGGVSAKAKKNMENLRAVIAMFPTGDFSKAGDYIATDGVDHSAPTGEVKGLDNLKAMFAQMMSTMSDAKNDIVKDISDDDYSMAWLNQSWTQKTDDPMMKMKVGDHGTMQTIEVCKHGADGKITDHWTFVSMADMMKMMPQQGSSMMNNMPDTTKTKKNK